MSSSATHNNFHAGRALFAKGDLVLSVKGLAREGASGHEFMVVVEGSAEVCKGGRRINLLGAGDFLGEIALITGRKRTASVTTLEPTRLLVITERDFRRLIRDVPSIQPKVMQALASRLEADD